MERQSEHPQYGSIEIAVLALILLLGVINLPQPFMGDQALNMTVAKKLNQGGLIYRDIWDLKQPGIFIFFWCGGKIFGFSEIGIHVFELLWMISLSVFLMYVMKDISGKRIVPSIAVLFTVGIFYSTTGKWHQTQTEIIVSFPIFIALWLAYKAGLDQYQGDPIRFLFFFFSGFFGGIVCIFKIALFPITGVFWFFVVIREVFFCIRNRMPLIMVFLRVLTFVLLVVIGSSIPIIFCINYLAHEGVLSLAFWTFFEYPFEAISFVPFRAGTLVNGLDWFFDTFSGLWPLTILGAFAALTRKIVFFKNLLILWLIFGFLIILFQRISWWQYHYYLLLIPIGILAAIGVEVLLTYVDQMLPWFSQTKRRVVIGIGLVALFIPVFWSVMVKVGLLAMNGWAMTAPALDRYRATISPGYAIAAEEGAFLKDVKRSEDFYVLGDPLYYLRTNREPPIPLPAGWFTPVPCLYDELEVSLEKVQPKYLFVSDSFFDEARKYTPSLKEYVDRLERFVNENWSVMEQGREGMWMVRKGAPDGLT